MWAAPGDADLGVAGLPHTLGAWDLSFRAAWFLRVISTELLVLLGS